MALTVRNSLNLGSLAGEVAQAGAEGLTEAAARVKETAQSRAPLLAGPGPLAKASKERRASIGELRDSAFTRIVDESTVAVGFSAFYAGWQHEYLHWHHEDGQAKYLESTLVDKSGDVLQAVADAIRAKLGG